MKSAFPGTAPSHSASSAKVMSLYATEGTYRRLSRSARCCASFSFGGGLYYEVERGGGPRGHEAVMGKMGKMGWGKSGGRVDWIGLDGMGWDGMGWDMWVESGGYVGGMRDVGEERGCSAEVFHWERVVGRQRAPLYFNLPSSGSPPRRTGTRPRRPPRRPAMSRLGAPPPSAAPCAAC